MVLPWDQRNSESYRYVIVDLNDDTVVGFAETEDEVIKISMRESLINKRDVEVYESTGFSSWKSNLKQ
jgi:hypothetical protein